MKTYKFTDKWGDEMDAYLVRAIYMDGSLAVEMVANPDGYWEEYATLSVNLGMGDERHAFVDVNNCPWATKFLEDNGLARCMGVGKYSGYCMYPFYEFTEKFFAEAEAMEE